jgi:hypothetical protein
MAFKRINSIYFLADTAKDLDALPKADMGAECFVIEEACEYKITSAGVWVKQNKNATESSNVDLSNYVTKDELNSAFEKNKANTAFGETEENMSNNPGSAFGIAVNKGDKESIVDKMIQKGIGLYTFWISKDNADLPAEVKAKNSSCRGLCCVDTVKDTGWYGWIQLFDHDGYLYSRYIRNSVPTDWRAC